MNHRWPALCGQPQYDYEEPRLTDDSDPYRRQRIKAIGNAVVPQIVYPVAKLLYEKLSAG